MACRFCEPIDIKAVEASVDAYINNLDKEMACDKEEYAHRLNICSTCKTNRGGLCGICGCFIKVRAYKKDMTCPSVTGDRWKQSLEI